MSKSVNKSVRAPEALWETIARRAAERGLTVNGWLVRMMEMARDGRLKVLGEDTSQSRAPAHASEDEAIPGITPTGERRARMAKDGRTGAPVKVWERWNGKTWEREA